MNFIGLIILVTLAANFTLNITAEILNLRGQSNELPEGFRSVYSPERYRQSQDYLRTRTRFGWVTATFDLLPVLVPTYTLTLVISPALSGRVTLHAGAMHFPKCVAPGGGVYDENTVVQLTAVPTDGYGFARWSGDLTATASMATLTMTRDMSVTASFELVWFEVYLPLVLRN